jgi:hypothetical protein
MRSAETQLLQSADLIILEELPMSNVAVLETIDDALRHVTGTDEPFGGKFILGIGDFRQVGPVIPGGGQADAFHASVKSSPLWPLFHILQLGTPMRYGNDPQLCTFVDNIGDNWEQSEVTLPLFTHTNSMEEAANFIYPNEILADWATCLKRAFLSPRNILVDEFNQLILDRLPGDERECLNPRILLFCITDVSSSLLLLQR